MSIIDKQRIAAVKKLEQLGYTFAGATANTVEPIVAVAKLNIARFMQPPRTVCRNAPSSTQDSM
jgi:hypothetical protein